MRNLGHKLRVEAMSLYNHVANKDDLLDGMVDRVFAEIGAPCSGPDWKPAMRERAVAVAALGHDMLAQFPVDAYPPRFRLAAVQISSSGVPRHRLDSPAGGDPTLSA
jgi:AcrR family transcriptional regulator